MVIIYTTLIEAQALSFRLNDCKSPKDQIYTEPVVSSDGTKFAVQVLEEHESHLTQAERDSLEELPADFYDDQL